MLHLARQTRSALDRAQCRQSFMSHPVSFTTARDPLPDHEQKQAALGYLNEAWAEARHDGVDGDCLAQASLFAAFAELVGTYGEDAVAKFVEGLAGARAQRRVFDFAGEAVTARAFNSALSQAPLSSPGFDRATQYSRDVRYQSRSRGVLDHPVKPGDDD